jgi:hypothetical protein
MLCGSEKGIRSIVAAKASGVTARLCLGSSRGPFVDYVIGYQTDSIAACLRDSGRRNSPNTPDAVYGRHIGYLIRF